MDEIRFWNDLPLGQNDYPGAEPSGTFKFGVLVAKPKQPISVFIADDQPEVRQALRRGFERDGRLEIVGETSDGADALREIAILNPDAVILDLAMPGTDGLAVLPGIIKASPKTKVIVFSTLASFHGIEDEALEQGAHLVMDKYTSPKRLIKEVIALVRTDG